MYIILHTKSFKIDNPMLILIFPLIHATNNESIAFAKSEKTIKFLLLQIK